MKLQIKKVGVLLRENNAQQYPLERLKEVFGRIGASVQLLNDIPPPGDLDIVLAMGGDGTVLHALDMFPGCPVVAINYGTVGFLTAGDRDDIELLLEKLATHNFIISDRILLEARLNDRRVLAVNEMILRTSGRMIQVDVFVDEVKVRTIRGDGVIVGTPTGSTAYLLSTGAPIVMPDVNCFVLDGLNEYNFTSRALIVSPDAKIRLHLRPLQQDQEAHLSVDGKHVQAVKSDEEIHLFRSEKRAQLIFFEENYFFHNLSSRLSWN